MIHGWQTNYSTNVSLCYSDCSLMYPLAPFLLNQSLCVPLCPPYKLYADTYMNCSATCPGYVDMTGYMCTATCPTNY
jgi:hypothetical protein